MQENELNTNINESVSASPKSKKLMGKVFLGLLALALLSGLGYLAYQYKYLFVVGRINGQLVTRMDLEKRVMNKYGKAALDELITERLAQAELQKAGVTVSKEEFDTRVATIEKNFAGMKLDDVLVAQGITRDDFNTQIMLQMGAEKYLRDKIQITDEEIATFITSYPTAITAEDDEGKKAQAKEFVMEQKLNEQIGTWISELRTTAKIDKYLP